MNPTTPNLRDRRVFRCILIVLTTLGAVSGASEAGEACDAARGAVAQRKTDFPDTISIKLADACTAILLGPKTLLTAGHCILKQFSGLSEGMLAPKISVQVGDSVNARIGEFRGLLDDEVATVQPYPGYMMLVERRCKDGCTAASLSQLLRGAMNLEPPILDLAIITLKEPIRHRSGEAVWAPPAKTRPLQASGASPPATGLATAGFGPFNTYDEHTSCKTTGVPSATLSGTVTGYEIECKSVGGGAVFEGGDSGSPVVSGVGGTTLGDLVGIVTSAIGKEGGRVMNLCPDSAGGKWIAPFVVH